MSEAGHDLHRLFPGNEEAIHLLKISSEHFRALADRHHLLGREIDRIETGIKAASPYHREDLKKERLLVLDEITAMISRRHSR